MSNTIDIKKYLKKLGASDLYDVSQAMNAPEKKLRKLLCGKLLGSGMYRDVYELRCNSKYVIKVEREPEICMFANITEFRNFINFKDWTLFNRWFAPCILINKTGTLLIQKRVYWDGKRRKDYPTHVPYMFTDLKLKNFGWIGDQFVCCDYSYVREGFTNKKMRYAKWWGTLKQNPL